MDNMVQALKMAFGIIITVLLISAIMFMYNKFKVLPEQKAIKMILMHNLKFLIKSKCMVQMLYQHLI